MHSTDVDAGRRVKSLDRAIEVLECLARGNRQGMTLAEVAKVVGGSKGNVYSILQTWLDRGFVRDSGAGHSRRYAIGPRIVQIADRVDTNVSLTEAVVPILRQLTSETGMTSRMAVMDDGFAVAISKVDAPGSIQFVPYLGRREFPHCSGVGKALLATLDRERVRDIVNAIGLPKRTQRTITSIPELLDELDRVTARGYAIDDEEDTEGVMCVGAAFRDGLGNVAGALSVSGLKLGTSEKEIHELGRTVAAYASKVCEALAS